MSARSNAQSIELLSSSLLSALKAVSTARASANVAGSPPSKSPKVFVPDPSSQTTEVNSSVIVWVSVVSASDRIRDPLSDSVVASPSVKTAVSPADITG